MNLESSYIEAARRIRQARRVLLVTHVQPDGDALGSICFMMEWLSEAGIEHVGYCAGPLPESLSFLPHYFSITTAKEGLDIASFDVIVSLDCGSLARTNLAPEISARSPEQFFIEIDHHPSVEQVSDLEIRTTEAASTTEILHAFAETAGIVLSPAMSKSLLTGLMTDTGNFTFSATSERTMAAASDMVRRGANLLKIVDRTWRIKKLPDLRLWGVALSRLELNTRYGLAHTVITAEDFAAQEADEEAMTGLAEFISSLPDVSAILVLRDDGEGAVRGNLRTTREDIDVAALARRLGGGGHRKAAGFAVPGRLIRTAQGWRVER